MLPLRPFSPKCGHWFRAALCFGAVMKLLERCFQDDRTSFHREVGLRAGQTFMPSGFFQSNIFEVIAAESSTSKCQGICIDAHTLPSPSDLCSSIAYRHRDRSTFLPRLAKDRKFDLPSVGFYSDYIAIA